MWDESGSEKEDSSHKGIPIVKMAAFSLVGGSLSGVEERRRKYYAVIYLQFHGHGGRGGASAEVLLMPRNWQPSSLSRVMAFVLDEVWTVCVVEVLTLHL